MPANIASEEMLRMALENAVSREDYELASQLRDELNRRRHAQSNEQQ